MPVHSNGTLVFGKCRSEEEFWVPLIEKACAKLHGCYQTLISGFLDDALSDLTGMVSEKVKIKVPSKKGEIYNVKGLGSPDQFWDFIMARIGEKSLMGCSVTGETEGELILDGEQTGILKGHAYGLIDAFTIKHKDGQAKKEGGRTFSRMLRIRNPWGKLEWKGKWSDSSSELEDNLAAIQRYIDHLDKEEAFVPGADDGTFLMCFSDFRNIFTNLFVAVDFQTQWTGIRFSSSWDINSAGGTPSPYKEPNLTLWGQNPQYQVEVLEEGEAELFISLAQPDGRVRGEDGSYDKFPFNSRIHPVCFSVMIPDKHEVKMNKFDKAKCLSVSVLKEHREVSLRMKLKKGRYIIVPSTRSPGQVGKFFLSLYFNCDPATLSIRRLDKNSENYERIAEESEHHSVNQWKIDLVNKRRDFMIMEQDELDKSQSLSFSPERSNRPKGKGSNFAAKVAASQEDDFE